MSYVDPAKGKSLVLPCAHEGFSLTVGAVEHHAAPESVYLLLRCWVYDDAGPEGLSPKVKRMVSELRRWVRANMAELTAGTVFHPHDYILVTDIGEENYNKSDKLHFHVEINLFQKKTPYVPLHGREGCVSPQARLVADRLMARFFQARDYGLTYRSRRLKPASKVAKVVGGLGAQPAAEVCSDLSGRDRAAAV